MYNTHPSLLLASSPSLPTHSEIIAFCQLLLSHWYQTGLKTTFLLEAAMFNGLLLSC